MEIEIMFVVMFVLLFTLVGFVIDGIKNGK
ncbi:gp634 [Bacillus phage G]|uniref:Gp634 n=1 Tax=Bacillus phage G TaxID=2884420 RepID=G3MB14_9CAUD|nr:gp634 [Bacillus phage G]AEO93944.1 gp634 [Bacillus phage G]